MFSIFYYNQSVKDDIEEFPVGIRKRYFNLTDRMIEYGPNLGEPHTKALGDGLFEIRAKGQEGIGRAFYCTVIGKRIVVLHAIIKKSQKTPKNDLDLAKRRMKEVQNAWK